MRQVFTVVPAVLVMFLVAGGVAPRDGMAGTNDCLDASAPNCGGADGDAACGDSPETPMDCVPDAENTGCECRPRICCSCENVGSSTTCNLLGCTETGIGFLGCLAVCIANETVGNPCNLKAIASATCSDGSCATTGCCTLPLLEMATNTAITNAATGGHCVETDQASCESVFGTFVEGGSCDGGLQGTCVAPTATATATHTATVPTATATASVTWTPTITETPIASPTPTNTLVPDGGMCETPSECASTFCVDGVCCDTACNDPLDFCNLPDNPGVCTAAAAQAPAMSDSGLFVAIAVLLGIGALAFMWRARA